MGSIPDFHYIQDLNYMYQHLGYEYNYKLGKYVKYETYS